MLTDVHDLFEGRVGTPVETSDYCVTFADVVLEQPSPHLECRQKVYLKNPVDWELVREDVKGLNWNEIITQSNFFAAGCKIMQHYVTNLYNIM